MVDLKQWTGQQLQQHSVDSRQFIDFRASTLANGSRIIDAYNSSGLHFTLLPDRGLDIWSAHYNGIPLTWLSQGSPYPPDFGLSWLQQFNGGLLTTCGLTHVGPPETDTHTGEARDLHGRYSRLPARDVVVARDGAEAVDLSATVSESRMFGEQLELTRWYTLYVGDPTIYLVDVVTNLGDQPAPLMMLYHINVGFPLVSAGARLVTPDTAIYARDDAARAGLAHWADYDGPTAGYAEQVFFHHVNGDGDGMAEAVLANGDLGLSIRWNLTAMPYLTQWKNTREGIYVSGIEPGNCIPEGQNAARQNRRLQMLAPGESQSFSCRIAVIDGEDAVNEATERVAELAAMGTAAAACYLEDYAGSARG